MLFLYKAKLKESGIIEGVQYAKDRLSLAHDLRVMGNIPLSIREKDESLMEKISGLLNIFSKVKVDEQIVLTKNLSGMLKAGLSLYRALSVLKKQTKNPKLDNILTSLSGEINSGGTLSSGFLKFPEVFSKLFISMTRAGEESGNLAGALSDIGVSLEKSHALNKKIRGALIYPGVILNEAKISVEKGAPFSEAFCEHEDLYPVMMSEMVQVGEETGKLSDMLLEVALFYEGEIENKTKNLSTIIEPVLMIFIGVAVGFFAISMISPLYSILGSIN